MNRSTHIGADITAWTLKAFVVFTNDAAKDNTTKHINSIDHNVIQTIAYK